MMQVLTRDYIRQALPVEVLATSGGVVARLSCSQCSCTVTWDTGGKPPPERIPKHFIGRQWKVAKKPICPDCQKQAQKEKPVSDLKSQPLAVIPQLQAVPTNAARAARAEAVTAIVTYFNASEGRYEEGWSDDRIAKETGLPVDWVKKRRDEDFGPLKEPGEFVEVRAEAKALASEIGKLQAKLDAMAKRNGWAN